MKIPIYEEIPLNEINAEKMRIIVADSKIGKVPTYINIAEMDKNEAQNFILELEEIMAEHNLLPIYPYPLYLISAYKLKSTIPIAKTVKDLPGHYFKKVKRPNNKEIALLNKLFVKVNKIKNLNLRKLIEEFNHTAHVQKNLYDETCELHFLESLSTKLKMKKNKR